MESSGSGARCPHWSETQMCDPQPCYHWNISVEKCMLLNPNVSPPCGLGTAYRTLACVNKLGVSYRNSSIIKGVTLPKQLQKARSVL